MKRLCSLVGLVMMTTTLSAAEPHPGASAFIERASDEHGFDPDQVSALLAEARYQQSIVDAMTRPAESKPWHEYRPIFLTERRISGGVEFWNDNRALIEQVSEHFGVDPQFIVSIIGVETFYGRITGSYRVLDALATLGFYYPQELANDRSDFFSRELLEFMLLGEEENLPLTEVTGSYAGAMGMGQFIPSSYRAYAVDFDANGSRDLWRSTADVVASVANYLHKHGWKAGDPVASEAIANGQVDDSLIARGNYKPAMSVGELAERGFVSKPDVDSQRLAAVLKLEEEDRPSLWLVFDNFYVITRYNRSPLYAMAVLQLSEEILAGVRE
jgi:membrane-bound lytic murein transglycosylase B